MGLHYSLGIVHTVHSKSTITLVSVHKSIWIKKARGTLELPQTSRANPVQCYSTHQEKRNWLKHLSHMTLVNPQVTSQLSTHESRVHSKLTVRRESHDTCQLTSHITLTSHMSTHEPHSMTRTHESHDTKLTITRESHDTCQLTSHIWWVTSQLSTHEPPHRQFRTFKIDYGVTTISRLLKIIGLFCRISSLL